MYTNTMIQEWIPGCVVDVDVHKYQDTGGEVHVPGCVVDLDVHKYHDTGGDVEGTQS